MINTQEFPRNGSQNGRVFNESETHLLVAALIDTSGSMKKNKYQLEEGIRMMFDSLSEHAKGVVEICIITFDDCARIISPFQSVYEFSQPSIEFGGLTAMHDAVALGLEQLEIRKEQLDRCGTPRYRSWMVLMSDGQPNDADNGAFDDLLKSQRDGHTVFYSIAIGDNADRDVLAGLHKDNVVLTAEKEDFVGAFEWLSKSFSKVSDSKPGERVQLPDHREYKMEALSVNS